MSVFDALGAKGRNRPDGLVWHDEADKLCAYNGHFASSRWQAVIAEAKMKGFRVELSSATGYMRMTRGASQATFTDTGDCINAVQDFLEGA